MACRTNPANTSVKSQSHSLVRNVHSPLTDRERARQSHSCVCRWLGYVLKRAGEKQVTPVSRLRRDLRTTPGGLSARLPISSQ